MHAKDRAKKLLEVRIRVHARVGKYNYSLYTSTARTRDSRDLGRGSARHRKSLSTEPYIVRIAKQSSSSLTPARNTKQPVVWVKVLLGLVWLCLACSHGPMLLYNFWSSWSSDSDRVARSTLFQHIKTVQISALERSFLCGIRNDAWRLLLMFASNCPASRPRSERRWTRMSYVPCSWTDFLNSILPLFERC